MTELCVCVIKLCVSESYVWQSCVKELCVRELCVRELCVREGGGRTGADGSAQQKNKNPTQRYGVKSVPSLSAFGDCLDIWNTISSDESCWSALISHQNCTQKMCVSHLKTDPFVAFPGFFKTNLMYQLDGRGGWLVYKYIFILYIYIILYRYVWLSYNNTNWKRLATNLPLK